MNFLNAKAKDYKVIEELSKTIWFECYKDLLSSNQIDYMINLFLSSDAIDNQVSDQYIFKLIINESNEPIGFFSYKVFPKYIFLSKAYILKDYRNKHIFTNIINFLEEKYHKKYIELTVNKNNEAIKAYEKLNFIVDKKVITDIGQGYVMDDYIMRKFLSENEIINNKKCSKKMYLISILTGLLVFLLPLICYLKYQDLQVLFILLIPLFMFISLIIIKEFKPKFYYVSSSIISLFSFLLIYSLKLLKIKNNNDVNLIEAFKKIANNFIYDFIYLIVGIALIFLIIDLFTNKTNKNIKK